MDGEWPDGGDDTRTLGRPARANAHETHRDANLTASPAEVASVPTVDAAAVLRIHKPRHRTFYDNGTPYDGLECWCGPWQGDAATGGCTAVLLAREVVALRERAETAEGLLTACRARFDVASGALLRMDARVALLEVALRRTHSRLSLIRHRGGIRWDVPGELAAIGSEWECDEILGQAEAALLAGGEHA